MGSVHPFYVTLDKLLKLLHRRESETYLHTTFNLITGSCFPKCYLIRVGRALCGVNFFFQPIWLFLGLSLHVHILQCCIL